MYIRHMMQRTLAVVTTATLALVACGDGSGPGRPPRSYLMGFSAIPPRFDSTTAYVISAIDNWVPHADAAIMHVSPPWAAMIGGYPPAQAVDTVEVPLANSYRGKGLAILPLFAHLGLADSAFNPKPALVAWDSVFRRSYSP